MGAWQARPQRSCLRQSDRGRFASARLTPARPAETIRFQRKVAAMTASDVQDRFTRLFGYWDEGLRRALDADPGFVDVYLDTFEVALGSGPLGRKTCKLMLVA